MQIENYMDVELLDQYVKKGWVTKRFHRTLPLSIYSYSKKTVYKNFWNDITRKTRGLIVDAQGTICGRGFEKFFNIDTKGFPETYFDHIPTDQQPVVLDKLNGSLGIIWRYGSFTGVASKGSFNSYFAEWASAWYGRHCPNPQWPEGYTPVVEMIAQNLQLHAVEYQGEDRLILTALVNNETGEELSYNVLYHYAYLNGMEVTDVYNKNLDECLSEDRPNKEGYVLSYPIQGKPPLKIKVKHPTFLKLRRVVHEATPRNILKALRERNFSLLEDWLTHPNSILSRRIGDTIAEFNLAWWATNMELGPGHPSTEVWELVSKKFDKLTKERDG